MKQPEPTFSSASAITVFPAVGPNDAPAPPLTLKIAFGESSKSSNAQQICINYTKGLSDEQVPQSFTTAPRPCAPFMCLPLGLPHPQV